MKLAVFAAIGALCVVAVAASSCTTTGITACAQSVGSCYGKNPTNHCVCFADELSCVKALGCGPNIQSGIVKGCEATGCSATACGGPIVNNCNATAMEGCASQISSCMQGGKSLCDCESDMINCYNALGCGSQIMTSIENACTEQKCTTAQCTPTNL